MSIWVSIKSSVRFYGAVFAVQVALFFLLPQYYGSTPNESQIPAFIKWNFVRYFGVVALLYLIWGLALGTLNGLAFRLSGGRVLKKKWATMPFLPWLCAQFSATVLLLTFYYPTLLYRLPPLGRAPLGVSYLLLSALVVFLAWTALRSQVTHRLRCAAYWIPATALPLLFILLLIQPAALDLPQARSNEPRGSQILLLGFDAMDGDSGNATLVKALQGTPSRVFNNAFTPLPLTHPAWHSILSGVYPDKHRVRFFFGSPQAPLHPELYLPLRLKLEAGYQSLFASDQPETSFFTDREGFDESLFFSIGWRSHLAAMMMNHFILPAVWINNLGFEAIVGQTANTPSLYNYDPGRFFNQAFRRFGTMSSEKRLMALHTCFLHTPIRLSRKELLATENYLSLSPRDFSFWKWPASGEAKTRTPANWINPYSLRREETLRFLETLVAELKRKSYFDVSTVAFLSDHGERFSKNHEIYGGIHGVDLETREQNNVMLAIAHPRFDGFGVDSRWTSLIDLTPTLMQLAGLPMDGMPYDGLPLMDSGGTARSLPDRPILAESMGFIDEQTERGEFPQLSIQTLKQSLIYKPDGQVIIGNDYYERILKKKIFTDLTKLPEMRQQITGKSTRP